MSTDKPTDLGTRWQQWWPTVRAALLVVLPLLSAVAAQQGCPRVVEVIRVVEVLVPAQDAPDYAPTQGWYKDESQIAANLDPLKTLQFAATPAGKAVLGEEDVFLYRVVRKAAGQAAPWYPNVNQQSVGCCVGCGWKHGCDALQASAIAHGAKFQWKPVSVEAIYGASRVEVGGGRISGDGSVGAWAKEAVGKIGLLPMEQVGAHDLSAFSPARAREWGRTGVPDELEPVAREHLVKSAALVRTAQDVKRAIQQGYPVPICSDQGFAMERDRDGFARAQGYWSHCMCVIGYRGGSRPGYLILNSWGDRAHTGPVWPADMPVAAFWIDEPVMDRIARQGDSFAISDVQGFPKRVIPLNWDVRRAPPVRFDPLFALAW